MENTLAERSRRFVSVAELRQRTSLSTSTIYKLMADGNLDRPLRITAGRVGWPADYVDVWLEQQQAAGSARR